MGQTLRKIELTEEAFRSCRDKPQYRFLVTISEAKPGEEFEIVGEDAILSFDTVLSILEDEGFEYDIVERDDLLGTYTVIARKRG
ncbi:glycosyltransferase [Aeropyrum camini SY1 = JCM 12091]|uniref:Glycosyltransferase n=1 Tax=Aeropyrum camini SY1 = JCM 12091 TaxID=1198449 RepID=U3TAW9_9CREN|nr:glycosyltransferase [Aeropyrum camini SY1 = JCM 12091]